MIAYFTNLTWPKLAKITWILIGVFIFITFSFGCFKYFTYAYNGLDLAIYNQVFFNSVNGQLFHFTIHPTSYLGDHFEIIILLLLPFYNLLQSPLTLIFIQACFLGLAAIPLYLIAKRHLTPLLGLLIICLYLFNPATLNIALYEFHILALVIFFALWAFYFYDQNKFWPFLAFCGLSLLIREDVAFIIFMFGIVALIDRKKIKWILTPLILATGYFFMAVKISAYFASSDQYKFLTYYGWLGNSIKEIVINFFLKFPLVLEHIFLNFNHLSLMLGLILIMLFIPIYRPKYLLLLLPTLLEFVLSPNSGSIVIQSHYVAVFLPALLIATIFSLKDLPLNATIIKIYSAHKEIIPVVLILGLIYNMAALGPLINFVSVPLKNDYQRVVQKNEFAKLIPADASVLTGFDLLPNFSSRSQLYFIRYVYLNRQQFNAGPYPLPENLEYIFLNSKDFQYLDSYVKEPENHLDYFEGDLRLRDLLAKNYSLLKVAGNLALWQKNGPQTDLELYRIFDQDLPVIETKKSQNIGDQIEFLGYTRNNDQLTALYFKCLEPIDQNYFLYIDGEYYMLGYGLYPTSEWQPGQIIQINLYALTDFNSFQINRPIGNMEKGPLLSIYQSIKKIEVLGEAKLD